ncbi:nuclear transport factor 2 family protein [Ktedonosporobacter rubrisoli]|uniref:Nuclear transport factor 2 family protein n=1 Tax=Ktedonosporobacter rubrisoli TaxID=2509675 RepID=A0A4P6JTU0_KTERU|nr:nuclear transport factor 2 family protein [Ktedonosporobacter rubrisoli]QBD78755.1 nuclear transport factor 2 family protein [Ktedonosporobacter rubrisoli]
MNSENSSRLQRLAMRYGEAWNNHDLAAIMSMHAENTTYHLHGFGEPYRGWQAVRDSFAEQLASYQALTFEIRSLHCGEAHAVFESLITGTTVAGSFVSFEAIDLLTIHNDLILTKDSYVVLRRQATGKATE